VVPLDAGIVLVHGENGAGKTSVLSALELALTGAITEMPWPEYRHLIHHGATTACIDLATSDGSEHWNIDDSGVTGKSLLGRPKAQFLTERCYLAQSTLGRLLEQYQTVGEQGESPLTKFVKDLLGLDELDALIDGLEPIRDKRLVKRLVPEYAEAEEQQAKNERQRNAAMAELQRLNTEANAVRSEIVGLLRELSGPAVDERTDTGELRAWLAKHDDARGLVQRIGVRQELSALLARWTSLQADPPAGAADNALRDAQASAKKWWAEEGAQLQKILDDLQRELPGVPTAVGATDPSEVHKATVLAVETELGRADTALSTQAAIAKQIEATETGLRGAQARLASIDEQIAAPGLSNAASELSRALAALTPHIHGEDCPVCGRDYGEVSEQPLTVHVAQRISELGEAANRLTALAGSRLEAVQDLAAQQVSLRDLEAQKLEEASKVRLAERAARMREALQRLKNLENGIALGADLMRRAADGERAAAAAREHVTAEAEIRKVVGSFANALGEPVPGPDDAPAESIAHLENSAANQIVAMENRETARQAVLERLRTLDTINASRESAQASITDTNTALEDARRGLQQLARQRDAAKALRTDAELGRTSIVGQVFNTSLNKIWRDLFVRLAPDEPFVPAFKIPDTGGPITANLHTTHRDGSPGGTPGAMLSAGNLNTAALTLFLGLHLTVPKRLPWLILDDPVQSMDEIHVAHFAGLLRTLAKQHQRRLIIAVHERALLEYLTLELSPAEPGDRLVTVDLTRSRRGVTLGAQEILTYESDAIAPAA
jgi:exonuclease SbcC